MSEICRTVQIQNGYNCTNTGAQGSLGRVCEKRYVDKNVCVNFDLTSPLKVLISLAKTYSSLKSERFNDTPPKIAVEKKVDEVQPESTNEEHGGGRIDGFPVIQRCY